MPYLHQWDYLFAFGTIFAALDAYNIGANDVANSFATSVSSRSLTMKQACMLAAICEFLGAVLVGAKVASTIKNGIISLTAFQGNAGVQLLAFTAALTASASWLMFATRMSWPVSTTYSIVSALAGVGVAVAGADAVQWGWNGGKGLATIFAGFIIAPAISAGFACVIYLLTKYIVLARKNSVKAGLIASPFYFFTVAVVLTMAIVYKGSPELKLDKLPKTTIALAIVLTGVVIAILSMVFWLPFVYCKVVRKDYTLRWYHFFYGPLLWKRQAPEDAQSSVSNVPDYRVVRDEHGAAHTVPLTTSSSLEGGSEPRDAETKNKDLESLPAMPEAPKTKAPLEVLEELHPYHEDWYNPSNVWIFIRYRLFGILSYGSSVDIHALQAGDAKTASRLDKMHARAAQYDNETEHLFSFLQVLTACVQSFAHGSNDTANAIGPFAAIYYIWSNGTVTNKNTPTPTWMLAFGAGMLVIGLATYGYNIMSVLGNRLTLHSPSRGFSMELGAAITVLLASQYGLPVSTTMCITGATAGVGIVSGGFKAVNWRAFTWIFAGWVITVPVVGTLAGCLCGIMLNSPHF